MKILLCLFNYSEIRIANMFAQMLLFTCMTCLLYQKIPNRILPFTLGVLTLTPIVLAMSLQFSPCYYVSVIAGILLLWQEKKIIGKQEGIFFLLVGMCTCYFDFLTYPSVTFAIPVMILISLKTQDWKCDIRDEIVCGIHWCVGYVGLWLEKWILGSAFLDENIIADAINQIRFRSGYEQDDITYVAVLFQNLKIFAINRPYWVLAVLFAALAGYQFVQGIRMRKIREMFQKDAAFLVTALIPFVWYLGAQNHSYVHSYFTARTLAISVIAIGCCLANNRKIIQRYLREAHNEQDENIM